MSLWTMIKRQLSLLELKQVGQKKVKDIKESIIHSYTSQTNKAKEHLYDYFVKHNMNQMMENIEDF